MPSDQPKNMNAAAIFAALDAALTITESLSHWLQSKRVVGELTPEEEIALDERLERMFANWNK